MHRFSCPKRRHAGSSIMVELYRELAYKQQLNQTKETITLSIIFHPPKGTSAV